MVLGSAGVGWVFVMKEFMEWSRVGWSEGVLSTKLKPTGLWTMTGYVCLYAKRLWTWKLR